MRLKQVPHVTGKFLSDNSPTLLTAFGVFGLVGTAYLTGKATFRAADLIREEEALLLVDGEPDPLTPREKVDTCWKLYIPAFVTGSLSIAAIIGANRVGTRRAAAVTAAYAISERAYEEYRNKTVEHLGEKAESKMRDEINADRVRRNPLGSQEPINTNGGRDLCYDVWNGRYFYSSMETIKQAQNSINYKVNHEFYASLTDFYDKLNLDKTKTSDDMGWGQTDQLEITFTTTFGDMGQPVLVMDFLADPIRGYQRVYR